MKITILSRKSTLYSTSRLIEAILARGCEVVVLDYLRCYLSIASNQTAVMYQGAAVRCDAVIPRIGVRNTAYGCALVRQFEMMQVFSANGSDAIANGRDKLRALQMLANAGIQVPVTAFAHAPHDIDGVIDIVGGAPLVVKLVEGTQGSGVVLAESRTAADSTIGAFRQIGANVLVQRFVKEAAGVDIRVLVVGGKVIAAMERTAKDGEFRANLHLGGNARAVVLTEAETQTAIAAAKVLQLGVAGVDILRGADGPLVIEVNTSPGLEGIENATGIDVAGAIVDYVIGNVQAGGQR